MHRPEAPDPRSRAPERAPRRSLPRRFLGLGGRGGAAGSARAPEAETFGPPPHRRLRLVVGGVWALLLAWIALDRLGVVEDDFYITFRYAWNLAHGNGLVFNPGERVFGTTAPGMALLLALLHALLPPIPIPSWGTATTAVALGGLAWVLLGEAARAGRTAEGVVAGTALVTCHYFWLINGSEAPVGIFLLVAAGAVAARAPVAAGALAAFAAWCRPDIGLGAGLLGLVLWIRRRRPPWAFGLTFGAGLAAGLAAAALWFGEPLPATLEAKRLQAEWLPWVWPSGRQFWDKGFEQMIGYLTPGATVLFGVGFVGHVLLVRRGGDGTRVLALYSAAIALAYPLLEVAFYDWYMAPVVAGLLYGFTELVGSFARGAVALLGGRQVRARARSPRGLAARAVAAALVVVLAWPVAPGLAFTAWHEIRGEARSSRLEIYRHASLWLRENSLPDEEVGYVEIGILGYHARRPIHDLLGLVTEESLPWVAEGNLAGAFLADPPELVVWNTRVDVFMGPLRSQAWFAAAYEPVLHLHHAANGEHLIVYRRREGARLPEPPRRTSETSS